MISSRHSYLRQTIQLSVLLAFGLGLTLFSTERQRSRDENDRHFEKLEPTLQALRHQSTIPPGETVPVIVQFAEPATTEEADSVSAPEQQAGEPIGVEEGINARTRAVYESGGMPERAFSHLPFQSARVSREALDRLARDPRVAHVSIDHEVQGNLYNTAKAIGADQIWAGSASMLPFDGKGINVAVLDSGIDDRSDLFDRIAFRTHFVENDGDNYGHGTHVAATIVGNGQLSKPGTGFPVQYKGIAYGAKVISVRVLGSDGSGLTSNVIAGLNWCIANRSRLKIHVINMSLGHPVFESYKTDPLCRAVEACVKAGMVVVTSAGNYGKNDNGTVFGGISSPGNDPAAITVGAVNSYETLVRSDDAVATYSSRGPTSIDGLIKPDLLPLATKWWPSPTEIPNSLTSTWQTGYLNPAMPEWTRLTSQ